jgi:hypothetical protein
MIDDSAMAPRLARLHPGKRRAHDAEDALEVDVEGVVPLLVGQVGKRHLVGDAGIGDDARRSCRAVSTAATRASASAVERTS